MQPPRRRDGPSLTPAVAMKQRQGPQIAAVTGQPQRQHIAHRVQVSAAMGIDHALGLAGGAGGIVQRDGLRLIRDGGTQRQIGGGPRKPVDPVTGPRRGAEHHLGQGRIGRVGQVIGLGHQDLAARVIEDIAKLAAGKPDVERIQHRAQRRHGEMGGQHLGAVAKCHRDDIARPHPLCAQFPRHAGDDCAKLGVAPDMLAPRHGWARPVAFQRPVEQVQRRQRPKIRRARCQMRIAEHRLPPLPCRQPDALSQCQKSRPSSARWRFKTIWCTSSAPSTSRA